MSVHQRLFVRVLRNSARDSVGFQCARYTLLVFMADEYQKPLFWVFSKMAGMKFLPEIDFAVGLGTP